MSDLEITGYARASDPDEDHIEFYNECVRRYLSENCNITSEPTQNAIKESALLNELQKELKRTTDSLISIENGLGTAQKEMQDLHRDQKKLFARESLLRQTIGEFE